MFIPISPDPPNGQNNNSSFIYLINLEIFIRPFTVIFLFSITFVFIESLNKSQEIGKEDVNQYGIYVKFICTAKQVV